MLVLILPNQPVYSNKSFCLLFIQIQDHVLVPVPLHVIFPLFLLLLLCMPLLLLIFMLLFLLLLMFLLNTHLIIPLPPDLLPTHLP